MRWQICQLGYSEYAQGKDVLLLKRGWILREVLNSWSSFKIYQCILFFIHWEIGNGWNISPTVIRHKFSIKDIQKVSDGISVSQLFHVLPLPLVLAPLLCFSVVCYNELSVLSDWSAREVEVEGEKGLSSHSFTAPRKKAYLCSAVDPRLSVGKSLGTPSALHPSACPFLPSSLTTQ